MRSLTRLVLLAGMATCSATAYSQFSWQNPVSGPWSVGTNWTGLASPNSGSGGSDVYIDFAPFALTAGPGNFTTTLDYNANIRAMFSRANFTMNGASLGIANANSQIDGTFSMTSSSLSGAGVTFNGATFFPGTAGRTLNGGPYRFMGPADYSGGILTCVNGTLEFGGLFVTADGTFRDGVHTILASGSIRKTTGAGNLTLAAPFNGGPTSVNVQGSLESRSGTIEVRASGSHTGTFYGNGGSVTLPVGTHTFLAGTKLRDSVLITGATVNVASGADTVEIIGNPEFQSGRLTGAGRLIGTGTLRLTTSASRSVDGTLTSQTNVAFLDGIVSGVNGTFNNEGAMQVDGSRIWRDGIFNNIGSLQKTGAGGATMGQSFNGGPRSFNNSGTVEVTGGSLNIVANGQHTGLFDGAGGPIVFNSSTQTFNVGHELRSGVFFASGTFQVPSDQALNCAGAVKFTGGILTSTGPNASLISGIGSLDIEGTVQLAGQHRLIGTLNWNSNLVHAVNSTFTNQGTFNAGAATDWRDGIFNNQGMVHKVTAGTTNLVSSFNGGTRQFNNTGTVLAENGTLRILANGTQTGMYDADGGQIQFPNSIHVFNTGTKLFGDVLLNGANVSVPTGQSAQFSGTMWTAGDLGGSGLLTGAGPFVWAGTANLSGNLSTNVPIEVDGALRHAVNSTFTNNGLMTFDGTNAACTWRDGILVNSGTIRSIAGTTNLNINFNGGTRELRNGGQIIADASTINVHGTGTHTGSFRTENGGFIEFEEGIHTMRAGSILGSGTITRTPMVTNESTTIEGESEWQNSTWSGTGEIMGGNWRWTTASSKSLGGHLKSSANIFHEAGIIHAVNTQFTNLGEATVANGMIWRDGIWFNQGTIQKVDGAGSSSIGTNFSGGPRSLTNSGRLFSSAGTLHIDTTLTNYFAAPDEMVGGTYAASGTGNLRLPIGPVVTNIGRFELDGPAATITQSNGSTPALQVLADNRGGLAITGGAVLNLPGPLTNSGDVLIGLGSSITPTETYTQTAGSTRVNGTLPVPIDIDGGILGGTGTANGGTVDSGTVAPGNSTGTLSILGNVAMTNSTLDIEVINATPGSFDRLAVSGSANISGGALRADAAPNTTVPSGTTVDVLTAASRVGTFTTNPNPLDWTVTYGATFVRLTAVRNIVGPTQVTGTVDLNGWAASYAIVPLTFELRQGGSLIESQVVHPNPDRSFALNTRRRGTFDLYVVGSHWLVRKYPSPIIITDAGLADIEIDLINGDCDQDNEVAIGDYAILSSAYNSSLGDPNFEASADLNGDEAVDIADYAILSSNYGLVGD